ncbi:unnamed protein product [Rhizophagus irregularis]|uniref:Ammonium transporter n=1 Tax=Rhizophagus irregularis TaxID=588596 RepID=A0A2I1GMC5_9GLOM|nr:ammonium transporter 2 [Rhizophagus irregularis]CAB4425680.1 unnamed protein product [Rhizophagus irregularis]
MSETSQPSQFKEGDIAWMLTSTAFVWLMIPGVGYFYSGMARSKNALSLILFCFLCVPVVAMQWFIWGYSLSFSRTGGLFIGNLRNAFFMNVRGEPTLKAESLPEIVHAIYQGMFAAITPSLAIGAAAERARMLPLLVFIFVWSTLVYDVIACWIWSANGWFKTIEGLDFAGGTPVHIASGAAALAYCVVLGKRHGHGRDEFKPHNNVNVILGTVFLWFGWFGFNGGSAFGANTRAAMAIMVTNTAASFGGLAWMLMDYRLERKFSALGFCSGAVAGLVCITPASGYVSPPVSVLFGITGGIACNLAVKLKHILDFDDALDVFAVHAVGGVAGNTLLGIFADKEMAALNGEIIHGGAIDGHSIQLGYQIASSIAGLTYSFCISALILYVMDRIPCLKLRMEPDEEEIGTDETELGEPAYYFLDRVVASIQVQIASKTMSSPQQTQLQSIDHIHYS